MKILFATIKKNTIHIVAVKLLNNSFFIWKTHIKIPVLALPICFVEERVVHLCIAGSNTYIKSKINWTILFGDMVAKIMSPRFSGHCYNNPPPEKKISFNAANIAPIYTKISTPLCHYKTQKILTFNVRYCIATFHWRRSHTYYARIRNKLIFTNLY